MTSAAPTNMSACTASAGLAACTLLTRQAPREGPAARAQGAHRRQASAAARDATLLPSPTDPNARTKVVPVRIVLKVPARKAPFGQSILFGSAGHPAGTQQLLAELARHARIGPREALLRLRRGHARQYVADDVEARLMLVVGPHHDPGRVVMVGAQEHAVSGATVGAPVFLSGLIDRADFPLLERVAAPLAQAARLLAAGDVEVILEEENPRLYQHALEARRRFQERLALLARAEFHDVLNACAVVPAAIEQHDLLGGRQLPGIALEVPLAALAIARLAGRHDPHLTRAQVLGDALDGAILAGGVAAFEDH